MLRSFENTPFGLVSFDTSAESATDDFGNLTMSLSNSYDGLPSFLIQNYQSRFSSVKPTTHLPGDSSSVPSADSSLVSLDSDPCFWGFQSASTDWDEICAIDTELWHIEWWPHDFGTLGSPLAPCSPNAAGEMPPTSLSLTCRPDTTPPSLTSKNQSAQLSGIREAPVEIERLRGDSLVCRQKTRFSKDLHVESDQRRNTVRPIDKKRRSPRGNRQCKINLRIAYISLSEAGKHGTTRYVWNRHARSWKTDGLYEQEKVHWEYLLTLWEYFTFYVRMNGEGIPVPLDRDAVSGKFLGCDAIDGRQFEVSEGDMMTMVSAGGMGQGFVRD
ncbi:hypothetical protein OOU_Y34scaffold01175g3 [Pyricularia oryzae Y34]|uniref:Uncharacterized protein n=1 Tax=Pyricularia oryzae (strain Y34) TaxID=1143189 RepID=A0AA97PF71_PYRO3|nr:hypothetical protein OOU_Y34scaffold01175g3 [Pyricularia oryzae Y34]